MLSLRLLMYGSLAFVASSGVVEACEIRTAAGRKTEEGRKANKKFDEGEKQEKRGNLAKAIAAYQEALRICPEEKYIGFAVGRLYATQGEFDRAYDAYLSTGPIPELPPNRVIVQDYPDQKSAQVVQLLLDQITILPTMESLHDYQGLALIMRHLGRSEAAKMLEEEIAIHKKAQAAVDAAASVSEVAMVKAEISVYRQYNRPFYAELAARELAGAQADDDDLAAFVASLGSASSANATGPSATSAKSAWLGVIQGVVNATANRAPLLAAPR